MMSQKALGPGTALPRRRALFGLLDAEGWGWASAKAFAWLIIIIFVLGYLPDRAYYLTVNRTVDLGVLAWSPINLCPPSNETLPCPAPVGALVPWQPSPQELNLRQARTDGAVIQVGTQIFYIGGSDGKAATSSVYVAQTVGTGSFDKWADGPALPAPRANASVVYVAGSIYVIGGRDASGAPTTTVFILSPNSRTGALGEWKTAADLALPEARSDAVVAVTPGGVLLIGGRNASGVVNTTWKTRLDAKGALGPWSAEQPLAAPQADATAILVGDYLWLYGGSDANGPVGAVQRGAFGKKAAEGLPPNPDEARLIRWDVNNASNLPVARTNASGWGANGAIYLAGGNDGTGPKSEVYWAVPTTTGDLTEWKHLASSDLPTSGLEGAPAVVSGPNVLLVGGVTAGDTVLASTVRANSAPLSPFFQLGLVGATVPGLKIEGEVGQQLGYISAGTVGAINFIILILIGVAFAHKAQTRVLMARVLHRLRRR